MQTQRQKHIAIQNHSSIDMEERHIIRRVKNTNTPTHRYTYTQKQAYKLKSFTHVLEKIH